MSGSLLLAALLWSSPSFAAELGGHACRGGEKDRYGYDARKDMVCRSEQDHLCRCRKETIKAAPGIVPPATYYDAKRDLCLDGVEHFQCLEKGGDYACRSAGRCLCDAEPRRCQDADLTAWKDYGCGQGNCEDTRLLQGREPKDDVQCRGGERWKCVESPSCPKKGKSVCRPKDFGPWRAAGCAVGGCAKGELRELRDKKTHLLCDRALYERCRADAACKGR